jgi:hypothetical protein
MPTYLRLARFNRDWDALTARSRHDSAPPWQ